MSNIIDDALVEDAAKTIAGFIIWGGDYVDRGLTEVVNEWWAKLPEGGMLAFSEHGMAGTMCRGWFKAAAREVLEDAMPALIEKLAPNLIEIKRQDAFQSLKPLSSPDQL